MSRSVPESEAAGTRPIRVCLVLEGTYPYVRGGVSSWTHQLITSLPEVEFELLTLSPRTDQEIVYEVPSNVVGMRDILVTPDGFELMETDARDMLPRVGALRDWLKTGVDEGVHELIAELESVARLRAGTPQRWRANLRGLIPRYRGGPWRRALNILWSDILGRYLQANPYYGLGEYFWTWYNSRVTLVRLLEEDLPRADVYHALCTGYAGFVAARARAERGIPFLLTEHGIYHRERLIEIEATQELRGNQRDQWSRMFLSLSRLAYRSADRIITLFEANRRLELRMGAPAARSSVIPNGIDIPRYFGVERRARPGRHIGLVGRVVPIKDIKTFLVAARITAEALDDVTFWIVGPTDESPLYYEECLQMTRAFGLEEQVRFTGPADVREYYAFLDVLVLTSLSEAQPLVILEAVGAGLPCVATRVGDVPQLLNHDQRLIAAPKDAQGIAERLIDICRHPEQYREWIAERQETVRRSYDRISIFRQYGELYADFARHATGARSTPAALRRGATPSGEAH